MATIGPKIQQEFELLIRGIFEIDPEEDHEVLEALRHDGLISWKRFKTTSVEVIQDLTKSLRNQRVPIGKYYIHQLKAFHAMIHEAMTNDNDAGSNISNYTPEIVEKFTIAYVAADRTQQMASTPTPSQFPESAVAALNEMVEDYVTRKRTIRLSDATQGTKAKLMDMLSLPEKGASWPNKPENSQRVGGFVWLKGDEDSKENRQAYMNYLKRILLIPADYDLADVQPNRQLLSVELFRDMTEAESRKVSGTTDVIIAKSEHVRNVAVRNNIETLLELKTPNNMKEKDHSPQTIGEHFAASYLNRNHAVVSVLTDLNTKWIFFWFAFGEDDSEMSLHKLVLDGEGAASDAKYLLDSLYDTSYRDTLPTTFAKRQPLRAVLGALKRKRARTELDDGNGPNPDQDSKPSSSSGAEQHPGSNAGSLPERNDSSGQQRNLRCTGGDESAPMSMANALSLFAPPADRDVANELDLLDMVDADEQYEIVKSFASKHIVPYMRG